MTESRTNAAVRTVPVCISDSLGRISSSVESEIRLRFRNGRYVRRMYIEDDGRSIPQICQRRLSGTQAKKHSRIILRRTLPLRNDGRNHSHCGGRRRRDKRPAHRQCWGELPHAADRPWIRALLSPGRDSCSRCAEMGIRKQLGRARCCGLSLTAPGVCANGGWADVETARNWVL